MLPLLFALACSDPPTPLPPSAVEPTLAHGRMVRIGTVQGFLARPTVPPRTPQVQLLLVTGQDETTRAAAIERAGSGRTVLAIDPTVPTDEAEQYLLDLSGADTVPRECLRPACP